ncbi:MAG: single-stranded-DNA-specific exonuclease RecJ [Oscillospiraceae bacterium]|nr:single-stranded-DNA-specific exonuclease RecJ [Oscillospiraceae bacterium]
MADQIWKIPYSRPDSSALEAAGVAPLLAALLAARGIVTAEEANRLLHTGPENLHDPFEMMGMQAARDRILSAIHSNEKVTVYGDYDVDGITSTCLLTDWLRSCGLDCGWYIPDRNDEGYGLNTSALQKLKDAGNSLVITVDCGITAVEEARFAREIDLDLLITDHHECQNGRIPDACAVIDPKRPNDPYPNPQLAGVGVAFKLISACTGNPVAILDRYADLIAVGTIADVMPLTGENRFLVKRGLEKLEKNPRPGFYAMLNEPGYVPRKPNSGFVGFTLAPRMNAAGRLGQTEKAEELLLTDDPAEAARLTAELSELNRERQKIETEIWRAAQKQLKDRTPTGPIVLAADGWHQGVIGIAASRLAEQYGYPTVMICLNGENGKGSCRSYGDFNLYQALYACRDLLDGFGGHALAAGLTIHRDSVDRFREALCHYYEEHRPEPLPDICCDLLIRSSAMLSIDNVEALDLLEPYGNANPKPVFCICDIPLLSAYGVGSEKQHLKYSIDFDGNRFDGIFFGKSREKLGIQAGDRVDIAFTPQVNEYLGNRSVQLNTIALRPHSPDELCRRIMEKDPHVLWAAGPFTPERSDFVRLWRLFGPRFQLAASLHEILNHCPPEMAPERYCLCLAVFSEAGLINSSDGTVYSGTFVPKSEKVDLDATNILKTLRNL